MPVYQKLQSKGAYADFTIRPGEIADGPYAAQGDDSWILFLINTTNQVFELVSLCDASGTYGPWFRVPAVGNNCATGYDECFDKRSWSEVLTMPRSTQPFSLRIATKPNAFGVALGTEFLDLRCAEGFAGGVIGIAVDG